MEGRRARVLSESVVIALRLAAVSRSGNRPMGTLDVLVALIRSETTLPWDYVTIDVGDHSHLALRAIEDPGGDVSRWEGVPISRALAAALDYADDLADAYRLRPPPPGLLAIALVADPESGAARRALLDTEITHPELVDRFHEHLLDGQLAPSDLFPPWNRVERQQGADRRQGGSGEIIERAERLAGDRPAGAVDVLRAACAAAPKALTPTLLVLGLDESDRVAESAASAAGWPDEPAAAVLARAQDLFDTEDPGPADLIAAATSTPSPAVTEMCAALGIGPGEIAAHVRHADLSIGGAEPPADRAFMILTVAELLISATVSALVIASAIRTREWWQLALVVPVWWGHPIHPPLSPVVVAAALAFAVSPVVGVIHGVGALLELPWARNERRSLWAWTGVRLSLREHRWFRQRMRPRMATAHLTRQRLRGAAHHRSRA